MTPQRRRIVVATTAIAVLLAGYGAVHDYFEAAAFVVRAAGMKGAARSFDGPSCSCQAFTRQGSQSRVSSTSREKSLPRAIR